MIFFAAALVGIFRNKFRQRVVPRQLAGFDQLRDGDRSEHLADRADVELRLVIDWHVEAAFGHATAFVEHGLAAIENGHAAGEIGYAYQLVQYGVYLFSPAPRATPALWASRHKTDCPSGLASLAQADLDALGRR